MKISLWLWLSITTTFPQFGWLWGENSYSGTKVTKLSRVWNDSREAVFGSLSIRTDVVILVLNQTWNDRLSQQESMSGVNANYGRNQTLAKEGKSRLNAVILGILQEFR